jgi:alanyl-tRNA synthetase
MIDLVSDIRKRFLNFFQAHDHLIVQSAPLIPQNDDSLLFINAGMAPLKSYFLGQERPPHINLVSCQKCIRAGGKHNDLDQVGYTKRHHTFFEMCGNFSFGGYQQKTAIELAWKFLTEELKLNKDKLWVTTHPDDSISKEIWSSIVEKDRMVELEGNEWSMGEDGPCGMCTEIFFDHGEHIPGTIEDGDRFVEIWNLVFMTHQLQNGLKTELPKVCIDTGMGLERIVAVLSGTDDNYKTALFDNIILEMAGLTHDKPGTDHRIMADHARAAVFAIADGIIPDVSSRGYVIRKIIRRGLVHAYPYKKFDLFKLAANYMITHFSHHYTELIQYRDLINSTLTDEQNSVNHLLDNAWDLIQKTVKDVEGIVSGEILFFLHDTHGVPMEVTCSILEQMGLQANLAEFEEISESKRVKRQAMPTFHSTTEFDYSELKLEAILLEQKLQDDKIYLVFDRTPFYSESGGQESDHGHIVADDDTKIMVRDVKKSGHAIVHICDMCNVQIGSKYTLVVDFDRRAGLTKHHSATHLLLCALRKHLGEHVVQKGSLVRADSLRFDFLHNKAVDQETLARIEQAVNEYILSGYESKVASMSKEAAIKEGAVATFGEKYGEVVRVVSMGPSTELCGGTHVKNSGDIGSFYILKEKGIAGGIRRIEAVAGKAAYAYAKNKIALIARLTSSLRVQEAALEQTFLKSNHRTEKANIDHAEIQHMHENNIKAVICSLKNGQQGNILKLTDQHIQDNDIVLVVNSLEQKTSLVLRTTSLNAVDLLKNIVNKFNGSCGGKAHLAQGGISNTLTGNEVGELLRKLIKDINLMV